jgi:hypothetical protein
MPKNVHKKMVRQFNLKCPQNVHKSPFHSSVNDFDVIDANVDGLISYGEFQRWHHAVLGAEPKASASEFFYLIFC